MRFRNLIPIAFVLLLSGCSSFGFLFERLDWLAVWQLDNMFDLTDEQEALIRPDIIEIREWLREEGFSSIVNELNKSLVLWQNNQLEYAFQQFEVSSSALSKTFIIKLLPLVRTLAMTMNEENAEYYREYCLDKQTEWFSYAESTETKVDSRVGYLEDWFGHLSDTQIAIVAEHIHLYPDELQIRIDNNRWREKMIAASLSRDTETLEKWITTPELLWSEQYTALHESNREAVNTMLAQLSPTLTKKQQHFASDRVDGWIELMVDVIE